MSERLILTDKKFLLVFVGRERIKGGEEDEEVGVRILKVGFLTHFFTLSIVKVAVNRFQKPKYLF